MIQAQIASILKRYRQRKRHAALPFTDGLPNGIEADTLNAICRDYLDATPVSYAYQHLSGWKSSGAFRLRITTRSEREIYLIYKNAIYAHDQIPALVGLPIQPGPAEYAIYSQPAGNLKRYLPEVYLAEEITAGLHYRYIMEDLSDRYRIAPSKGEILSMSCLLPELHQALREWAAVANTQNLIQYNRQASLQLAEYARVNLEKYNPHSNDSCLRNVLSQWPQIAQIHAQPEFLDAQPKVIIHGDTNYSNIYIHRQNPGEFKIVDWEWAGFGTCWADLASLVKGAPLEINREAFLNFINAQPAGDSCLKNDLSTEKNFRLYLWCQLERGLLDAGFLAAQHMNTLHLTQFSLPKAINQSLQRVLTAYEQLSA